MDESRRKIYKQLAQPKHVSRVLKIHSVFNCTLFSFNVLFDTNRWVLSINNLSYSFRFFNEQTDCTHRWRHRNVFQIGSEDSKNKYCQVFWFILQRVVVARHIRIFTHLIQSYSAHWTLTRVWSNRCSQNLSNIIPLENNWYIINSKFLISYLIILNSIKKPGTRCWWEQLFLQFDLPFPQFDIATNLPYLFVSQFHLSVQFRAPQVLCTDKRSTKLPEASSYVFILKIFNIFFFFQKNENRCNEMNFQTNAFWKCYAAVRNLTTSFM